MTTRNRALSPISSRAIPAPTFLRVVSVCAMLAPILAVVLANVLATDARHQAQMIVASLELTALALGIALALRAMLGIAALRLREIAMDESALSREAASR